MCSGPLVIVQRILVMAAVAAAIAGCTPTPPSRPLHVATNAWLGYEPLYLARSLGYLSERSVVLHELPNASDAIKAFRNRAVDAVALTLDETLLLLQDGIDARVLLVMDVSCGADVIVAHPAIRDIKGLRGKRVGVESTAVGAYLLSRALETEGMTPADITVVPMGADEHEAAFAAGKVDAVVTFEPVRTRLLHQGGKVVFDSRSIPDEIVDVLVVRDETRRSSPREIRSLEDGWYRALDYLQSKPDDACQRMARREGVSPGQLRMSLQGIKIPGREENERLVRGGLLPAARRLADLMLARRLLRAPVDPAALLASHGDVP